MNIVIKTDVRIEIRDAITTVESVMRSMQSALGGLFMPDGRIDPVNRGALNKRLVLMGASYGDCTVKSAQFGSEGRRVNPDLAVSICLNSSTIYIANPHGCEEYSLNDFIRAYSS